MASNRESILEILITGNGITNFDMVIGDGCRGGCGGGDRGGHDGGDRGGHGDGCRGGCGGRGRGGCGSSDRGARGDGCRGSCGGGAIPLDYDGSVTSDVNETKYPTLKLGRGARWGGI